MTAAATEPLTSQWAADKPLEHIAFGHQSHDWMASKVRMLMRGDLDHEAVCTGARDRIVWLAARLAEAEAKLAAVSSPEPTREMAAAFKKEHDEYAAIKIPKIYYAGQREEINIIVGLRAALAARDSSRQGNSVDEQGRPGA